MKLSKENKAAALLLFAAFMWGSSFVGSKICLNAGLKPFETVFYRMVIGTAGVALLFRKELRHFTRDSLKTGLLLGVNTALIYTAEMYGISMVETTKASFLTSTNIVMMPFLCAVVFKTPPKLRSFLAAIVTISGVAVMSLTGSEKFAMAGGDVLLLCAGFFYATASIIVAKYGRNASTVQITFLQLFVSMVYTGVMMLFEGKAGVYEPQTIGALLYLAIGPTLICFLIKNFALQYLTPIKCTLILSTEGVFCALLSVLILHDHVTLKMLIGILLIFTGISIENFGDYVVGAIKKKAH